MEELPTFTSHLECSETGERYGADELHNLSAAGKPLLVRYDLDGIKAALDKETLARRPSGFWRYRELLPVRKNENVVRLGEVTTPILTAPALSRRLGCGDSRKISDTNTPCCSRPRIVLTVGTGC